VRRPSFNSFLCPLSNFSFPFVTPLFFFFSIVKLPCALVLYLDEVFFALTLILESHLFSPPPYVLVSFLSRLGIFQKQRSFAPPFSHSPHVEAASCRNVLSCERLFPLLSCCPPPPPSALAASTPRVFRFVSEKTRPPPKAFPMAMGPTPPALPNPKADRLRMRRNK